MDLQGLESRVSILEEKIKCLDDINEMLIDIKKDIQPLRDWSATGRSVKRVAMIAGALTTVGGFLAGVYAVIKLIIKN